MVTEFKLDGTHTLTVTSNAPRLQQDPGSVHLQVTHKPLDGGDPKTIFAFGIKPSEARVIASSILSAATEAR